jgi:capsular polysaccharide biosynthesis protein
VGRLTGPEAAVGDLDPGVADSVLRYLWIVVLAVLLGSAGGWGLAQVQEPSYDAYAYVLLADPSRMGMFQDSGLLWHRQSRYLRNQARQIRSRQVLDGAAGRLGGRFSPAELAGLTGSEPASGIDRITVRGTHRDRHEAAAIADAVAASYVDLLAVNSRAYIDAAKAEIARTIAALEIERARLVGPQASVEQRVINRQLDELERRTGDLTVAAALVGDPVIEVQWANVPEVPVIPRPRRSIAAGTLLGGLVGAGIAWTVAWRRQVVREPGQVTALLGAPLLAHLEADDPDRGPQATRDRYALVGIDVTHGRSPSAAATGDGPSPAWRKGSSSPSDTTAPPRSRSPPARGALHPHSSSRSTRTGTARTWCWPCHR